MDPPPVRPPNEIDRGGTSATVGEAEPVDTMPGAGQDRDVADLPAPTSGAPPPPERRPAHRERGSTRSVFSIGSAGSILSIGSAGSILSIGSAGSILSIGSAGSILSIGSLISAGSALSVASAASAVSVLAWRSFGVLGPRAGRPRRPGRVAGARRARWGRLARRLRDRNRPRSAWRH